MMRGVGLVSEALAACVEGGTVLTVGRRTPLMKASGLVDVGIMPARPPPISSRASAAARTASARSNGPRRDPLKAGNHHRPPCTADLSPLLVSPMAAPCLCSCFSS